MRAGLTGTHQQIRSRVRIGCSKTGFKWPRRQGMLSTLFEAGRGGRGKGPRSGPWPAEHMPRPQRDLELEAAVGIAQLITEPILHLAQPVPDDPRVHAHMRRHLVGVAACWSQASNVSASRSCWAGRMRVPASPTSRCRTSARLTRVISWSWPPTRWRWPTCSTPSIGQPRVRALRAGAACYRSGRARSVLVTVRSSGQLPRLGCVGLARAGTLPRDGPAGSAGPSRRRAGVAQW